MMEGLGDAGSSGTRWVCPNDRHLALRAKLHTGWSVKTGSFDSRYGDYVSMYPSIAVSSGSPFMLTEDERRTIIEVIQRAEALDLLEQERVGKLVERLENMKRNVSTVTATRSNDKNCGNRCSGGRCVCSCALCGERFAVLGSGSNLCKDCCKYICQKCGIEASPLTPTFTSSKSTLGTKGNAIAQGKQRSSNSIQKLFLCRICSETREMWKKSGAWFFKGLPKYVLPEKKKERGQFRVGSKVSGWMVASGMKTLETLEQDSSSDEDGRRLIVTRSLSASVGETRANEVSTMTTCTIGNTSPSYCLQSSGSTIEGDHYSINDGTISEAGLFRSQIPSSTSVTALRSQMSGSIDSSQSQQTVDNYKKSTDQLNDSQVYPLRKNSTDTSFLQPEQNVNHERDRYWSWDQRNLVQSNDHVISNHNHYEQLKSMQQDQATSVGSGHGYGTLEISLHYDSEAQCLQCRVERARGLRAMDIHGLADPFCKLNILPITPTTTTKRLRTKTVHKTRDPEFNEMVNFYGTTETDMKSGRVLHVLILQDDPAGHDFLGEAKFPLNDLQPYQTKRYNVFLEDHYLMGQEEEIWGEGSNPRGQIQLTLSYNTRRRALLVTVQSATNLLPMDNNGLSDPFVKLCLIKDSNHSTHQHRTASTNVHLSKKDNKKQSNRNTYSTSVKWKTLNPEWNEDFAFETRLTDLTSLVLSLSVWDKDFGKSNDYLGGLTLSCSSKGERLRHWIDAIKFPDHRHQAWHNLTDTIVPIE